MNQVQAQNAALSFMLAQQAKENAPPVIVAPKERKLRVVKDREDSPSSNGKNLSSAPAVDFKFPPGTYDAKTFMVTWRRCKDRNEMMQAINGYTGYDVMAAFSVNEYNAKTKAQKELKPPHQLTVVKPVTEAKTFVAGKPDHALRRIADLVGREALAAEALIKHELTVKNMTEGSEEQTLAMGLAELERERLKSIRADLSMLVK